MALSNEEVMERFMAFTVDGDSPKSFTLRGSQLVVSSVCAAKPGTLYAQTPMQDVPVPVAVLAEGSLTALLNLMFFEEDEKVVFSTDEGSVLHASGRVALSRALQDEIEDDEEDVERMRVALGASRAGADGDEEEDDDDEEDIEDDEEAEAEDDDDEADEGEDGAEEEEEAMSEEAQAISRKRAREEAAATQLEEDEALLVSAKAAAKERVAALEPRLKETKKQRQRREKQEAAELAVAISKRAAEAEEAATEALEVAAEAAKAKRPRKAKSQQDRKEVQLARGVNGVELFEGMGAFPKQGRKVTVRYVGRLADGSQFDANDRFSFRLGVGEVVPGFDIAVKSMRVGGKRRVVIPPEAGYGSRRSGPIPPNSHLVFDLELVRAH